MFKIGDCGTKNQRDRIVKASITPDTSPPNISFLWKTHKQYSDIPPTRPVCDSSQGPLSRTSDLLTKILTPIMTNREYDENCDSTEDLLSATVEANEKLTENNTKPSEIGLMSMDAEALYPSLDTNDILNGVWELITESDLKFENVDIKEIAKYISIMYSKEDHKKHNIVTTQPTRQVDLDNTARGKLTIAYLDTDKYTRTTN